MALVCYKDFSGSFLEAVGKTIREISIPRDCIIAIIKRKGALIVPRGETRIEAEDEITIIGTQEAVKEMASYFEL